MRFITDEHGTRIGVLMDLADYESLLGDLHDLGAIVDRRTEPAIPHEELLKLLRAEGLLPD
ncbi:hypothetical protein OKA05_25655 [Luteolibacter arcticus]|uniref:Type II toxin-antitoxin system Phd/YefM family antitoxin n=1 Tax=Luteolibacter arcticus TaxID=1581411 RepID=A0ABT3GR10_9BACT|nr:hypothetical protein [Luteolibacter arcticus]MCW1925971.1 hypothetical protein [Luteolibacter arcticus]